MTQKELEHREDLLQSAGYHKSRNTSSTNDYSWIKTVKDRENKVWLCMIEWRVWDWSKYVDKDPSLLKRPYSMDLCIIAHLGNGENARMVYPDGMTILQAEKLADDFYKLINN